MNFYFVLSSLLSARRNTTLHRDVPYSSWINQNQEHELILLTAQCRAIDVLLMCYYAQRARAQLSSVLWSDYLTFRFGRFFGQSHFWSCKSYLTYRNAFIILFHYTAPSNSTISFSALAPIHTPCCTNMYLMARLSLVALSLSLSHTYARRRKPRATPYTTIKVKWKHSNFFSMLFVL